MGAINTCKRIIIQAYKNKTLFILIFVPIISFLVSVLVSSPNDSSIKIGIYDEDKTELSSAFVEMISSNAAFEVTSDLSSIDEMKEQLENQDIVIGVQINKDLYENIEETGSIQLLQTYDVETFKLVELCINSIIDNIIVLKKATNDVEELVINLDTYLQKDNLKTIMLDDEKANGLFSTTSFGFLTMFMLLVSVLSSKLIADDRFNTTIKRIFVSPLRKMDYILAGFLANFIFQIIQVIVIILICIIMDFQFPMPLSIVIAIFLVFSVFASFFGMFIAFISNSVNQMLVMSQMFMLPGMLLCGTFFEFSIIPSWLQKIAFIFPQTWISQTAVYYTDDLFIPYFAAMSGYILLLCSIISVYLLVIFKKRKFGSFY